MFKICTKGSDGTWRFKDAKDDACVQSECERGQVCVAMGEDGRYAAYRRGKEGMTEGRHAASRFMTGFSRKSPEEVCAMVDRHVSDRTLKEAVDFIGRVNLERRVMVESRLDESPEVGLFWVDVQDGRVYGDGKPIRDGMDFGDAWSGYVIHPSSHYDLFGRIKAMNPRWRNVRDYEDIPRGRVIFSKEPGNRHFIVYMSPCLNDEKYEGAVRSYFGLPSGTVFDYSDDHYVIQK